MKNQTWNGFSKVEDYVNDKISKLAGSGRDFASLYNLMFSEKDNVFFEKSNGYKIEKLTYGECAAITDRKAVHLKELLSDLPENSVVGIYMENSAEWIQVFWAVLKCSFRPLLMNMRLPDDALNDCLALCGVRAIVSDGKLFSIKTVISSDICEREGELLCPFGSEVLFMSSGTSQSVKVCGYTAEELFCQIYDSTRIIKQCKAIKKHYNGNLKLLAFLPFYHIFGFCAVYLWFAFYSRTFVYLKDLSPNTLLNTIRRHEVTHIFAVPMFWDKIYSQALKTIKGRGEKTYKKFKKGLKISNALGNSALGRAFAKKAFKEVRENLFGESVCFMIAGGSVISRPVFEFFNGIGYPIVNGYGMTETGITSVELSKKRKEVLSLSVGKPFSSVKYKIEGGELCIHGASLAGYVIEGGQKRVRDKKDWFKTGDLAECVKGRYFITGRVDDLVVSSSGENLNPNLIEPLFMLDGVREVCLIGEARSATLLVSMSPYLSRDGAKALLERLKDRAKEKGVSSAIGKIVPVAEPLVKGDEFKLNRLRISKDYFNGKIALYDIEKAVNPDELTPLQKKVQSLFASALGKEEEDAGYMTDFFSDEGGTSLDYFSLASALMQEFGVDILAVKDEKLTTVMAIAAYIGRKGV